MACFIVPLVQAVATTAYRKRMEKTQVEPAQSNYHALSKHLPALEKMLWGGSLMLIVDHILNGEVTWMYPFFTALETEGGGSFEEVTELAAESYKYLNDLMRGE